MTDELYQALRQIKSDIPKGRENLSLEEKLKLLEKVGPRRVQEILKAKGSLPMNRIPFIFNNLDTQDLMDILSNDFSEALKNTLIR